MQVASKYSMLWQLYMLWALCIILRTHAKQCHCMSQGSMLLYAHIHCRVQCVQEPVSQQFLPCSILYTAKHVCTIPTSSSPGITPASTTAVWVHLRALRDTGNTCHGSPDLGKGSSRAHTCTSCPWNAKRKRQDYGCTVHACVGSAEGVQRPVETNRPSEWHTGCMQSCEPVDHNW